MALKAAPVGQSARSASPPANVKITVTINTKLLSQANLLQELAPSSTSLEEEAMATALPWLRQLLLPLMMRSPYLL